MTVVRRHAAIRALRALRAFTTCALLTWAAACGRADAGGFRVALLTPGPVTDQAWNAGAYAGLMRIRDSLGARVSHTQVKTPADFEENFRQYAQSGYAIVIGHGFEFQDAASRVAPSYPKTIFLTTGGDAVHENQAPLSFAFDEPSYLAGMAAAAASTSGVVACVGGTELPPVKSSFAAFAAGARAARPGVRVIVTYVGSWDDVGAGKEQALALVRQGADVIFQNADAAGLGVFQAAREHPGLRIVGSNQNQNAVVPGAVIGSVVIDLAHAFLLAAREVAEHRFTARVIRFTTTSDVVRWEPSATGDSLVPPPMRARIDSTRAAMLAGRFAVSPTP